jgi:hypothetical protein
MQFLNHGDECQKFMQAWRAFQRRACLLHSLRGASHGSDAPSCNSSQPGEIFRGAAMVKEMCRPNMRHRAESDTRSKR